MKEDNLNGSDDGVAGFLDFDQHQEFKIIIKHNVSETGSVP
jgi:hypothetical protein